MNMIYMYYIYDIYYIYVRHILYELRKRFNLTELQINSISFFIKSI